MRLLLFLSLLSLSLISHSQQQDNFNILLNAVVLEGKNAALPQDAKEKLQLKLARIAAENGVGGTGINPRFVIAAKVLTNSKDIIAGPPQMLAVNLEFVFYVGDAANNTIFNSTSIEIKGVGGSENVALSNAIQQISSKNKSILEMISVGKSKISEYYSQNCESILSNSKALAQQQKFDQAIYELLQMPFSSSNCYANSLKLLGDLQQLKINTTSKKIFNQANTIWMANPNKGGAEQVASLLAQINPLYTDFNEVKSLVEKIKEKIEVTENRTWDFKLKEYNDSVKLEELRIDAAKQTAIEYHRSQPKSITYNYTRISWW